MEVYTEASDYEVRTALGKLSAGHDPAVSLGAVHAFGLLGPPREHSA
ncbi:hypothetical protein [Streptomyces sp. HC307]